MDCKSFYLGSIPRRALYILRPSGGIGIHKGLKIPQLNKLYEFNSRFGYFLKKIYLNINMGLIMDLTEFVKLNAHVEID